MTDAAADRRSRKAFDTRGPVIVGVHVDYRDNHQLFEMLDRDIMRFFLSVLGGSFDLRLSDEEIDHD
jgi:hypothetical protein